MPNIKYLSFKAPGYTNAIAKAKREWKGRKRALSRALEEAGKLQRQLEGSRSQLAQKEQDLSRTKAELESGINDLVERIQDLTVSLTESKEHSQRLQNELEKVHKLLDSEQAKAEQRTVRALVTFECFVKAATKQAFEDDLVLPFLENIFSSAEWLEKVRGLLPIPKAQEP